MAIDMDQVRAALEPEEPNYPAAAKQLGPEALPFLERIITGDHELLAAKAAYLAGLIGGSDSVSALEKATNSSEVTVRIAAAAAARHLSAEQSDRVILKLIDDADPGVRKVAARSAPRTMSDALKSRVAAFEADATAQATAKKSRPARGTKRAKPARRAAKKAEPARGSAKKAPKVRGAAKKARHR